MYKYLMEGSKEDEASSQYDPVTVKEAMDTIFFSISIEIQEFPFKHLKK